MDCLQLAKAQYPDDVIAPGSIEQVFEYIIERFRAWYEDEDIPAEVFKAVSAKGVSAPLDIERRVHAVNAFTALPEATALAAANKRVANILAKLKKDHKFGDVSANLLVEPEEKELWNSLAKVTLSSGKLLEKGAYTEALASLAVLRGPLDAFFDDVLVNAEDMNLRNNRLNLLKSLRELFTQVADISQLAVGK
ncbi:MAG: glycyl-tRNA synthetase beta chain [Bacteroidia bacterium]|jgi:glycyl-tRNA synthetase beta chain